MGKKINKTRFAVLGMLFEKPHSGYEIRRCMLDSTDHFWQETDASIYPMLKVLEEEGKVTSESKFVGKRERKVFTIAKSGKDEFLAWMVLPPQKASRRSELLLKLFFGATIPKEITIEQLAAFKKKIQKAKKTFKSIEKDTLSKVSDEHPNKLFWHMALRHGIIDVNAKLKWVSECLKMLEKK